MIEAFHSNWTAPFFELNSHNEYYIEDFEYNSRLNYIVIADWYFANDDYDILKRLGIGRQNMHYYN